MSGSLLRLCRHMPCSLHWQGAPSCAPSGGLPMQHGWSCVRPGSGTGRQATGFVNHPVQQVHATRDLQQPEACARSSQLEPSVPDAQLPPAQPLHPGSWTWSERVMSPMRAVQDHTEQACDATRGAAGVLEAPSPAQPFPEVLPWLSNPCPRAPRMKAAPGSPWLEWTLRRLRRGCSKPVTC